MNISLNNIHTEKPIPELQRNLESGTSSRLTAYKLKAWNPHSSLKINWKRNVKKIIAATVSFFTFLFFFKKITSKLSPFSKRVNLENRSTSQTPSSSGRATNSQAVDWSNYTRNFSQNYSSNRFNNRSYKDYSSNPATTVTTNPLNDKEYIDYSLSKNHYPQAMKGIAVQIPEPVKYTTSEEIKSLFERYYDRMDDSILTDGTHGQLIHKKKSTVKNDFFYTLNQIEEYKLVPIGYSGIHGDSEEVTALNISFKKYFTHIYNKLNDPSVEDNVKQQIFEQMACSCSGHCSERLKGMLEAVYSQLYRVDITGLTADNFQESIFNRLMDIREGLLQKGVAQISTFSHAPAALANETALNLNYYRDRLKDELGLKTGELSSGAEIKFRSYIAQGFENSIRKLFYKEYNAEIVIQNTLELVNSNDGNMIMNWINNNISDAPTDKIAEFNEDTYEITSWKREAAILILDHFGLIEKQG